ncbi:hypothetical protein N665_0093s0075 [Sinapis alba]|nr:hypothetical protein N665_0093s0075 [Sinapis alba]
MRLFLLLAFGSFMLLEAYRFSDETDKQALFEFKSQVSESKRFVLSSWNHSFPLCNWYGVTCGRKHLRVTRLDLGGLKLGGVISPSVGNLSFLISLNLSDNSFGGVIPRDVGNLFRLHYLDMSVNFLRGGIPTSLANCSRLLYLYLYSNHLEGSVHSELGSLTKLVSLYVGENYLKGTLPASLGNLTSLRNLSLHTNNMEGGIPYDMARLNQMVFLELSVNNFSDVFPLAFYNMSSLKHLNMFENHFSGSLRPEFGNLLPNLQEIYMGYNSFTGTIPTTLSNISYLRQFTIEDSNLRGSIPLNFGKLRDLEVLSFLDNYLGSRSFGDLDFIDALTNCTQLQLIDLGANLLGGDLPNSIANLSLNLNYLSLQDNLIVGSIPLDIGNLLNLQVIWLSDNLLMGPLPKSIGKILGLGSVRLNSNIMLGEIPSSIGNLSQLVKLSLSNNNFEGVVPPSLRNCSQLLELEIGSNKLKGTIPQEIMQIPTLVHLNIEGNSLTGPLPSDVERLQNLLVLSLGNNRLSGQLPQTLGKCLALQEVYLQGNSFDGDIPNIQELVGLKRVDFSNNYLSGSIPEYFANFSSLEYLNLSINSLEGKVPTIGKFKKSTIVLVFGNKNLCGGIKQLKLKPCSAEAPRVKRKHPSHLKKVAIGVSIGIALLLLMFIALVSLYWLRKRKRNHSTNNPTPSTLDVFHEKMSYGEIRNATDGFSSNNMIGSGSFGTVFKAFLPAENKVVAVKVLNLQRRGAMKSFMAECESLKDIRHRNLVKLLTACSSIDFQGNEFRALIYEFMPNGSLDMWLHPEEVEEISRPSRTLTLLERLSIAIDVASVLDYLHVHCHEPIAHCDLKPSNVLLDDDLTAHVSDFGLARLLLKFDKESFLNQLSSAGVRGTIGYAAPEYGVGGQPSIHGDVYSFGVLLLEIFSGKRPTNELFEGNFTIHSYTKSALPERVLEIADKSILQIGLRVGFPIAECLALLFDVGLRCCEESPTNRLETSEVAKELITIKERFFKVRRTARR